jgi:hypothetical protein
MALVCLKRQTQAFAGPGFAVVVGSTGFEPVKNTYCEPGRPLPTAIFDTIGYASERDNPFS